ncbi:MAG: monomethylamine:corrinoid methyltransferase [Methanosarcinaceae archaeon]|nr:monomethylamine:corrinoid methyltransferase [Methanosarcinaceae archaeon]
MIDAWDVYLRSTEGKPVSESEFDLQILPMRLMELAKEYDITYDPEVVIPSDRGLFKSVFEAAITLLVDVGFLNTSTGRIIAFDEYELRKDLRLLPGEYRVGEGNDAYCVKRRDLEDKSLPTIVSGPTGAPLTEEYFIPIMQSYAMEPSVKEMHTATLLTINDHEIKSRTTAEMMAARREITLTREATRRAGRPGLGITGTMSGTTSEAQCFGYGPDALRSGCDRLLVSMLNELKVDWDVLKKALFAQQNNLGIANCMGPVLGGYMGGPETTLIGHTAECIASFSLLGGPSINHTLPNDAATGHKIFSENIFAMAGTIATLAEHTKAVSTPYCSPASGMATENFIYEIAAQAGMFAACGSGSVLGANGSNGAEIDAYSGMNARILDESLKAFLGKSLEETNEIVIELIKHYGGDDVMNYTQQPPKRFHEVYNLKTLKPSNEFVDLWENAKANMEATTSLDFFE